MRVMSVLTLLLCAACRVAEVPAPQTVAGILGPIRVEYIANPVVEGDSVWGAYNPGARRILVDASVTPLFRRNIIAHERCHSALADLGIALEADKEEQVCNAMAALEVAR